MASAPRRKVKMTIVSDTDMKDAANAKLEDDKAIVPQVPEFSHIFHSSVRQRRNVIEIEGYDLGIIAMENELAGAEQEMKAKILAIELDAAAEIADIDINAKRKVARLREDFVASQSSINRRIEDFKETRDMLQASVDLHARRHPKTQETTNAQTEPEHDPASTGAAGSADGDA
jgi:hypothetical protein